MQADPLEAVFQKLSKEDKIILQLSRDKEKVESDNEKLELKLSYELQLQLKTAEGNLELQAAKHELLLNTAKSGFELEKQQYEHEILNLKKELSIANWEYVKNLKLIKITTFLDLLDEKRLDSKIRDRRKRFEAFAEMNSKNLKEWNLTIDSFIDSFMKFSNKVCSPAHPFFDIGESLIIEEKHLEPYEFKLLGFLWEMFPLPPEKLQVKKLNNDLVSVFDMKVINNL